MSRVAVRSLGLGSLLGSLGVVCVAICGGSATGLPAGSRSTLPKVLSPDRAVSASEVSDFLVRRDNRTIYRVLGPAQDYARNCQGCHGIGGHSVAEVPDLQEHVGYFARIQSGRAYLVQVPNVAQSVLSDARLADLMNWMLHAFSEAQLPSDFRPYTAAEVAQLRRRRIEPAATRKMLAKELWKRGELPSETALEWTGHAQEND